MTSDELTDRINALASDVEDAIDCGRSWKEIWDEIKFLRLCLKDRGIRFPTREGRQQAWDDLDIIVQRVNTNREERSEASKALRDELIDDLETIYIPLGGVYGAVGDLVSGIGRGLMAMVLPSGVNLGNPTRDALKAASERLREIRATFHDRKRDLLKDDHDAAWKKLCDVSEQLNQGWSDFRESERSIRQDRLDEVLRNKREYLERLHDQRERLTDNISKNQDKLYGATSDSYRARVESWIADDEGKLASLDARISDIESAIEDIQTKLDDLS